jgi:hypothetical protein
MCTEHSSNGWQEGPPPDNLRPTCTPAQHQTDTARQSHSRTVLQARDMVVCMSFAVAASRKIAVTRAKLGPKLCPLYVACTFLHRSPRAHDQHTWGMCATISTHARCVRHIMGRGAYKVWASNPTPLLVVIERVLKAALVCRGNQHSQDTTRTGTLCQNTAAGSA